MNPIPSVSRISDDSLDGACCATAAVDRLRSPALLLLTDIVHEVRIRLPVVVLRGGCTGGLNLVTGTCLPHSVDRFLVAGYSLILICWVDR